jgi:hypothetical protein
MAKRFTDTSKYKKSFYRSLPGAYKLFYDFLYHDCDHAGIWIVDMQIAQTYVGHDMPIDRTAALNFFNSDELRIVEFDGGKKWFIPLFISFQYGQLSEKNRAHSTVIQILKKFTLIDENLNITPISQKPLTSPLQGAKEKDMEQEKEMEKEQEQDFGKSENLFSSPSLVPQMQQLWVTTFPAYTQDKELDFPALRAIAGFIFKNSGNKNGFGNNDLEIKALNTFQLIADQVNREPFWVNKPLSSISKNIQEFYNKIKNPINGTDKSETGRNKSATVDDEVLKRKLAERLEKNRQSSRQ